MNQKNCDTVIMLKIEDIKMAYWGDEPFCRLCERENQYLKEGGLQKSIRKCDIRDNLVQIHTYAEQMVNSGSTDNIIIDISTLPKRYFFPIVKYILKCTNNNSILVTYTVPEMYDHRKPLAIDPGPWRALPGFRELFQDGNKNRSLIVGLGYEPLGLPQILRDGEFNRDRVHLLFPFPAHPSGYLRNWEFVRNLDSEVAPYYHEPIRVNGYDVSTIYDILMKQTNNGEDSVVFAPYGTKPMSLAMCLYSCMYPDKASVYYTQPKSYNPLYSSGVKTVKGEPAIYAYCIRNQGIDLYH